LKLKLVNCSSLVVFFCFVNFVFFAGMSFCHELHEFRRNAGIAARHEPKTKRFWPRITRINTNGRGDRIIFSKIRGKSRHSTNVRTVYTAVMAFGCITIFIVCMSKVGNCHTNAFDRMTAFMTFDGICITKHDNRAKPDWYTGTEAK